MVEPFSLGAIGAVALGEGIKFLYGQAGELLKRWRERREESGSQGPDPELRPPAGIIEGTLEPTRPSFERLERLETELRELRRSVGDYAEGVESVDPSDEGLLEQVDALRRVIEVVYGQRITFKGELREPSGPLVEGELDVDQVAGDAAAVRARVLARGRVTGTATAKRVEPGGKLSGVDIDRIG